ncbi:MAG: AI-2E family transporter [Bacteroidales bacterium]|nr:AI-2E family transporter [Bacteroidales bacterium]
MNKDYLQYLKPITGFSVLAFMAWYFSDVVGYILVATFLSMMGAPLTKRLNTLKYRNINMPKSVSAMITMLTIFVIFGIFVVIIAPLIIHQANIISSINIEAFISHFQEPMDKLDSFLVQYNVINSGETLTQYIQLQISELVDLAHFTNFFSNLVSATGSVLMGIFIVLFLTYYFLLDDKLLKNIFLILSPEKYVNDVEKALHDSKFLLVRYFHGILTEVLIMMSLETIGLLIIGVPNAVLIGFFGGLMNVIPYLGPIIGMCFGIVLGVLSELSAGNYDALLYTIIGVAAVFGGSNIIDNLVLQPLIYSRSVKAHPVEVFLAIIIGGKISGIVGMILAIPTYTIIKVILRQFLNQMKLVKYLTSRM